MKKKVLFALLTAFVIASLVACGGNPETNTSVSSEETNYADADYMSDLSSALQKRWDAADKSDEVYIDPATQEYSDNLKSIIDIELSALEKYRSATFEDGKLQGAVIAYINILEDSRDAAGPVPNDYEEYMKYEERWDVVYNERLKAISEFVNTYGLTVDEQHQAQLDEFIGTAQKVVQSEETQKKIDNMFSALEFKPSDISGSYKTYSSTLVNNTGVDFSDISLAIDLMNDSGVIIEQTYAGTGALADGKSIILDFATDKDFATYEIHPTYYLDD